MCLIIAPGADGKAALLPEEVYNFTYTRNNDGFGAMWAADGRVQHLKLLNLSREEEYEKMKELTEEHPSVIFHMRYKTHGKVIPSLCHPFRILHKNRHGKDLFFMHNGILSSYGNDLTYGQSDTTVFKDKILIPLLTRNPDALDDPAIMDALNKMTSGSRLIFLDSDGKVYRTSESSWNNRYGLTLSNTYMLPAPERSKPTYNNNNDDNKVIGFNTTPGFTLYRKFRGSTGGLSYMWCKQVVPGLVRNEQGCLYKDNGYNEPLTWDGYIYKKDEEAIIKEYTERLEAKALDDDDLDDDHPLVVTAHSQEEDKSVPASIEERLRYARVIHNLHDGLVTDREQLLADLIGMGNREMSDFCKEDPGSADIILSELIEIILEQNNIISLDPTCQDMVYDLDKLDRLGQSENHQENMKRISDLRKKRYAELAEQVAALEEEKRKEKAA